MPQVVPSRGWNSLTLLLTTATPQRIVSDQGSEFQAEVTQQLTQMHSSEDSSLTLSGNSPVQVAVGHPALEAKTRKTLWGFGSVKKLSRLNLIAQRAAL